MFGLFDWNTQGLYFQCCILLSEYNFDYSLVPRIFVILKYYAACGISVPWAGIEPGPRQWTWKPVILTTRSPGNNSDTLFLSLQSFMNSPFSIYISNHPHLTFCFNCSLYPSLFISVFWKIQSLMGVTKHTGERHFGVKWRALQRPPKALPKW